MSQTVEPILALDGVTVAFGALVALDDVTFSVMPGATVGVVGPNGAGKTTLLNVLSGHARPRQGQVRAFGREANGLSPERLAGMGVGRSFQLADQFGRLSVGDFMMLGLATRLRSRLLSAAVRLPSVRREEREARELVGRELEVFGLGGMDLATRMQELPYGVRKRLDIARAAISQPRVLLVDEPTSGLAASESDDMGSVLRTLVGQRDTTLIIVDHRVSFVTDLCPTLIALDFGRLIGDGPSDRVLAEPQVRRAFLGIADEGH